MNGVCCRKLVANIEKVMDKIKIVENERLQTRILMNDVQLGNDISEKTTTKIEKYANIFRVLDIVFSSLRILCPNTEEIEETKEATMILERLWREMEINITPKAHILFVHAVPQFEALDGIADKVEDFVEKAHQEGKKLDHLTGRMNSNCYKQQQLLQLKTMWIGKNTIIEKAIVSVDNFSKRKFKNPTKRKEEAKPNCKKIRIKN